LFDDAAELSPTTYWPSRDTSRAASTLSPSRVISLTTPFFQ
jgi:hypothetical protein